MTHRSAPARPASTLNVWWIGLYELGWSASALIHAKVSATGARAADPTAQVGIAGSERADRVVGYPNGRRCVARAAVMGGTEKSE